MAPCTKSLPTTGDSGELIEDEVKLVAPQAAPRKFEIIKTNLVTFGYGHLAGAYGLYLCFTEAKWQTLFMSYIIFVTASIGVTAGTHRLWTHRSYKAKMPLQIILMFMNTLAFQNSAINWVRDHRLHHKYSDTDADPHNATRGFFYSHIGWLLVRKHPEVKRRGKTIDMSDIYANPVLVFQKKYAIPFIGTVCFVLPTLIPVYFWGESLKVAWHVALMRYVTNLHTTFLVNSAAHLWGMKPYDRNILPVENKSVSFLSFGEGFHNYHHVFPWDYKTAELGNDWLNLTTYFIDFFAWIGWAYDLKTVSDDIITGRAKRTGDGSYGKVDEIFGKVDGSYGKVDERYGKVDKSNGKVNEYYGKVDEHYGKVDESYGKVDERNGKVEGSYEKVDKTNGKVDESCGKVDENYAALIKGYERKDMSHGVKNGRYGIVNGTHKG